MPIRTGDRTDFGSLAASIVGQRQLTSFDKGIDKFTGLMISFIAVMVPAVFLIYGLFKHNWLEAFRFPNRIPKAGIILTSESMVGHIWNSIVAKLAEYLTGWAGMIGFFILFSLGSAPADKMFFPWHQPCYISRAKGRQAMNDRTDIPNSTGMTKSVETFDRSDQTPPRSPLVSAPVAMGRIVPLRQVPDMPSLDGRICILDSDHDLTADLASVLEAMGHEALAINEIIGASNRIRAFNPEILIVDAADTSLSGGRLIQVLQHNLGELPRIVFFTDMTHASLREMGLGEYEWLPKSGGFLYLVNRIRVLLMSERTGRHEPERVTS